MKTILIIRLSTGAEKQIELMHNAYSLGRASSNDIEISADVVSRDHGKLEKRSDGWWYRDLESRNGTYLNERQIREIKLQDGMKLQLGRDKKNAVYITFQGSIEKETPPQRPVGRETVIERTTSTTGYVHLQGSTPSKQGRQVIGRGKEADIRLQSPVISREHASIQPGTPEWTLTDLGSKNGTFLNGKRITRAERLKAGDVIHVGPFRLNYEGSGKLKQYAATLGLRVDGKNLTKIVWEKVDQDEIFGSEFLGSIFGKILKRWRLKTLLNDVSISCYPKEFIAFVGGSGAGKSTLMKTLNGLLQPEGKKGNHSTVLVEGDNLYDHYDAYRTMIGYVPQDDILHSDLKVQEALEYSARLRLPPDTTESEIRSRIDDALNKVELTTQQDQVISSLSGGQRKRASIAVELLADPPLFFLDEPTSGLDPGLEKKVMVILRKLADSGKTIVLVTHATANITECHQVAFLSQGRLVYFGPPRKACEFFRVGSDDFAEIYNLIGDAETWEKKYRTSPFFKQVQERFQSIGSARASAHGKRSTQSFSIVAFLYQFLLLTKRYFSLLFRDRTLLIILLAVMPLLAFLILGIADSSWLKGDSPAAISQQLASEMASGESSASYFVVGNAQKLLFIMALTAVMLGLFSSAYEIVKERTIYMRERMVFMKLIPYLASKIVPLGIFAAVQCFLFLLVIGSKVEFPSKGVFLPVVIEMYITIFLAVLTAISLGLFISSISPNQNTVTYIILGVLFLQITFAGVIFDLPGAAKNLSGVTLTRWTMQALGATADLEGLDTLSLTRFQPDPITQEVSVEVEKPDPDWQPVTITTEMKEIPGCRNPVAMPVVVENELVTVMETVKETVTIDDPDPVEIRTEYGFTLNYASSIPNLIGNWFMLVFLSILFIAGTLISLKRKDIV
jgi:ABC-type multidrug transport system ATPase subunit/pSer/pThr/pTyr-binding forkhead associated (FHA) protein